MVVGAVKKLRVNLKKIRYERLMKVMCGQSGQLVTE